MSDTNWEENLSRPLRTIVVDDEALGRELILRLASATEKIDVVGEFSDAVKALDAVEALNPDIAFFDIQMPKLTGIEAARRIAHTEMIVVFVTAFEEHALEAFEVQAFDYLLKPIGKDRFHTVCERAFVNIKRRRLERVFGDMSQSTVPTNFSRSAVKRIKIRDGSRLKYVDPCDVIRFEAANQYVQIHTRNGSFLISSESLNSLQENIDPNIFVRVHRSSLVNIKHAIAIRVDSKGAYFIVMSDGANVRVSRTHRNILKDLDI